MIKKYVKKINHNFLKSCGLFFTFQRISFILITIHKMKKLMRNITKVFQLNYNIVKNIFFCRYMYF